MWDFDADLDADLDLGARRKPVEWVAFAPPVTERVKQQVHKRAKVRSRKGPTDGSSSKEAPLSAKARAAQAAQATKQRQRAQSLKEEKTPLIASGVHNRNLEAVLLDPEDDEGNIEYKLRLKQPNPVRFQQLVTQMQYRLSEGNGECFYYLGVEDDGYPRGLTPQELDVSFATLKAMAGAVHATLQPLKEMPACRGRVYVIFKISRICLDHLSYTDLRVAVAGSVDSGKSTMVAVLTNGRQGRPLLDNGQGSARMSVFKHKHEIETGRTSSLSHHMLAYDSEHRVLNYADVAPLMPSEIAAAASKVVRFIDLGGHHKYLKTALYGMTSLLPDYVIVCICPLTGLTQVTREHLAVALALELPVAFLITKVDIAPPEAIEASLESIQQILEAASTGHCVTGLEPQTLEGPLYTLVNTEDEAVEAAVHATQPAPPRLKSVPVFSIAATTGAGLPVLHAFLSRLQPHQMQSGTSNGNLSGEDSTKGLVNRDLEGRPTHFQVDQTFDVKGVGSVVSGTLVSGSICLDQELLLGTQPSGRFTPVTVTSIQRAQVPVKSAVAGQHATLAIHSLEEEEPGSEDNDVDLGRLSLGEAAASGRPNPANEESRFESKSTPRQPEGLPIPARVGTTALHAQREQSGHQCESNGTRQQAQAQEATDRRHDTWQSNSPASPFTSYLGRRNGQGSGRASSSLGGDSEYGESPRMDVGIKAAKAQTPGSSWNETKAWSLGEPFEADGPHGEDSVTEEVPGSSMSEVAEVARPRQQARQCSSEEIDVSRSGQANVADASTWRHTPPARPSNETQKGANPRKGSVLLDRSLSPVAVWQFEAVVVLLSGFWPPRGLLSGGWPPLGDSDGDELLGDSCQAFDSPAGSFDHSFGRTPTMRMAKPKSRPSYSPVVHCGSVRQAARVVSMAEVALPDHWRIRDCCQATGCQVEAAIAAAACLIAQPDPQEDLVGESCVSMVTFRFLHQPEWLQEGARFVVRDCTEGCTSGAGVVKRLLAGE